MLPPTNVPQPDMAFEDILPPPADVDFAGNESWDYAPFWYPSGLWEGSFEVGLNGVEGNAQSFTMRVGANAKRTTDWNRLSLDTTYTKGQSNSVETQNNALFSLQHDWLFKGPWEVFLKNGMEYDEFKAFDLRISLNSGFGYRILQTERLSLKSRLGAGWSRELGGPVDEFVPEGLFGLNYEHQLTQRQKLSAKADYLPSWNDFSDFRVETSASWELLVHEAANLSLKFSINDRYDSTPNGLKANDFDYALVLLWKR